MKETLQPFFDNFIVASSLPIFGSLEVVGDLYRSEHFVDEGFPIRLRENKVHIKEPAQVSLGIGSWTVLAGSTLPLLSYVRSIFHVLQMKVQHRLHNEGTFQ